MKKKENIYWQLYKTFFKIGGFTIGGGYVMLPMIQREVVDVKKWATEEEVIDFYALGQSVPGIIAINTATMVGYKMKKVLGAIAATAGMITPSLLIIMVIAAFFTRFQELSIVQSAFNGIRVAVVATIAMAVIRIGQSSIKDWFGILLATAAFLGVILFKISPALVIIMAALFGIFRNIKSIKDWLKY